MKLTPQGLRKHLDPATATGDALRPVQDRWGLTTLEAAQLLLQAHRLGGRRKAAPGSIVQRLIDSDSEASLPFARRQRFVPDPDAPRLGAIGTVTIGRTTLPRFGLGCMRLLSQGGSVRGNPVNALGIPRSPEASRHALLSAVRVSGVRMLDLARGYGPWPGAAEGLIRDWFSPFPPQLLVASKVGYRRELNGNWRVDLDPAFLRRELEASCRQLGGPVPLMYLVLRSTPSTPVDHRPRRLAVSLAPLVEAQKRGLLKYIGVANVTARELDELCDAADVAVVQNRFSLASLRERGQQKLLERTSTLRLPLVTWGLFGEGQHPRPPAPAALARAAAELNVTVEELSLALVLRVAPHLVPLPGPSRRATVDSSIAATQLKLPNALATRLLGALT